MINNSGNVGIGTASPGYKLDVQTSTANDQAVRGSNTATTGTNYGGVFQAYGSGATTNVGGYFLASGATNNYGLIVEAGNVGIGTASPATKLDVSGQARATLGFLSTGTTLIQGANNNDSTKGRYRVYMDGGTSRNSVQMIVNISVAVTAHVNFIRVTFIERNTGTEAGNQQYVAVSEWGCPQIPRSARSTRSWSRCGQ
ncbi:MAG: hypothetical protein HYY37_03295 [Candidatus Aenigmarchaeota archaeon]|nr:hypothetical protein [Candidatus Aenigmarchaeota archaeon]